MEPRTILSGFTLKSATLERAENIYSISLTSLSLNLYSTTECYLYSIQLRKLSNSIRDGIEMDMTLRTTRTTNHIAKFTVTLEKIKEIIQINQNMLKQA